MLHISIHCYSYPLLYCINFIEKGCTYSRPPSVEPQEEVKENDVKSSQIETVWQTYRQKTSGKVNVNITEQRMLCGI